ncbi:MAG: hypothetical protein K2J88_07875 [Oscillospiraceae bacterium]|nr:hypothetical protein [Oscillospiraceae bacterium]
MGNIPERKDLLTSIGYDYATIQAEVSKILNQ